MKRTNKKALFASLLFLLAFTLWTMAVLFFDVKAVGPLGSFVGLAKINTAFHDFTGVHLSLYIITDWLGLVPIAIAFSFAMLGLVQWIKRKRLSKVDHDILLLGGFYTAVFSAYVIFEYLAVNYRPVLIEGILEPSYPSSTTLLVLCVLPTAMHQFHMRIKNKLLRMLTILLACAFTVFTVAARLISGVHWLSDIIGGVLLSASLVMAYYALK